MCTYSSRAQRMTKKQILAKAVKVVKLPLHFIGLFTGQKSSRDNPIIGSRRLNKCGLHVARVVIAAGITKFRYLCLTPFMSRDERRAYAENGFVLIENYLPQNEFDALNIEVRSMSNVPARQMIQGDTLTQRVLLNDEVLAHAPACKSLVENKSFLNRLSYTSARNSRPIMYVQRIKSNALDAAADPQRTLHSDTFHATMKAWLFLDDVSDLNGPFTCVPGSQRLSIKH